MPAMLPVTSLVPILAVYANQHECSYCDSNQRPKGHFLAHYTCISGGSTRMFGMYCRTSILREEMRGLSAFPQQILTTKEGQTNRKLYKGK